MKRIILGILIVGFGNIDRLNAQGYIYFANFVEEIGLNVPVVFFDGFPLDPGPEGTIVSQLYAAQLGSPNELLSPIGDPVFLLSGAAAGYWTSETREIGFLNPGEDGYFQVRVWDTFYGETFEEARLNFGAINGESTPFAATAGSLENPGYLTDLSAIPTDISLIPEPSTWILFLAGGLITLFRLPSLFPNRRRGVWTGKA